jgi:hypothetical protein
LLVVCQACGHSFASPGPFSLYEQQAVESSPCPGCGRVTLCVREPEANRRQELTRRRRERAAAFLREVSPPRRPDKAA